MKKILCILSLFAVFATISPPVHAQLVKKITVVKDSTVNADFTTLSLPVDPTVKSFEVNATKVSGTVAGKAVLEGLAHDGTNWVGIDSLTFADQPINFKVFPAPTVFHYQQYRFKVTETGTGKIKPIVAYTLRRN